MASIEGRKGAFAVKWRMGGRHGKPQTLTLIIPDGHTPKGTLKLAKAAKGIAEAHGHNISHDEVRQALPKQRAAVVEDSRSPRFDDWVATYIAKRRTEVDIQPDTVDRYELVLKVRAIPFLGGRRLAEITPEVIGEWVGWLTRTHRKRSGEPLAADTVRRAYTVLHGCLAMAVPLHLPANPAARESGLSGREITLPKRVPFKAVFLTPREVDLIVMNASPQSRVLFYLLYKTGLRLGEAVVLRNRDLALAGRNPYVSVVRALKTDGSIGRPKSDAGQRDVTVSPADAEVLAQWVTGRKRDDLVFPTLHAHVWTEQNLRNRHWIQALAGAQRCGGHPPPLPPKPTSGRRRGWRPDEVSTCACTFRLSRSARIHDLRHSHVSALIDAGWREKRIQVRVGHADYQTTMNIYGHLLDKQGDAKRLDEVDRMLATYEDEEA